MASETWELRITGYAGPQPNQSVQHYVSDNVPASDTPNTGADLIASWVTSVQAVWLAMLPNDYYLDELQARRVDPKFSAVAHKSYPFRNTHGSQAQGSWAMQTCPCITLVPPRTIKSGGKIFLPAMAKGTIIDNTYQPGIQTALTNWFNVVKTNFGTGGLHWQLAIYSRKLGITSQALSCSFSSVIGYQERRRAFFGRDIHRKKKIP
jgi:hypothetical protein